MKSTYVINASNEPFVDRTFPAELKGSLIEALTAERFGGKLRGSSTPGVLRSTESNVNEK